MIVPCNFNSGIVRDSDDCTATKAQVLSPYTAITSDSDDEPAAGTMTDNSGTTLEATASLDSSNNRYRLQVPNNAYYNTSAYLYSSYANTASTLGLTAAKIATGNTILGIAGTYTGVGTATASQVLSGYTFSNSSSSGISGTMTDKSGSTTSATASLDSSNSRVRMQIPTNGYYNTSAYLYTTYSNMASVIGLTAAKLGTGQTCLGITGTYKPTVTMISSQSSGGSRLSGGGSSDGAVSYTCTAAGTCYYGGITAGVPTSSSDARPDITNQILLNGTVKDSRDINSDNSYAVRGTMFNQSFSVSAGDVVTVYTHITSAQYLSVACLQAVIVTYT